MDSLSSVPSALLADDTAVGHAVVIDRRVVNSQDRLGCKRQKKNKIKLWSFDWSAEYFYEAAKPLNFIIVQSRHSWHS